MEVDQVVRQSMLYDFYGELLTAHQRQIYEEIFFQDLSYTEVAEEHGISRQGVYDLLKRCNKALEEYEEKLKLVEKFRNVKQKVKQIQDSSEALYKLEDKSVAEEGENPKLVHITEIRKLAEDILEAY